MNRSRFLPPSIFLDFANDGEIIEAYFDIRPLPCCLILGFKMKNSPLHVVTAIDAEEQMLWVITVYRPSVEEWDATYRKRINL